MPHSGPLCLHAPMGSGPQVGARARGQFGKGQGPRWAALAALCGAGAQAGLAAPIKNSQIGQLALRMGPWGPNFWNQHEKLGLGGPTQPQQPTMWLPRIFIPGLQIGAA